jgi:hypothetical protein
MGFSLKRVGGHPFKKDFWGKVTGMSGIFWGGKDFGGKFLNGIKRIEDD